MKKNSYDAKVLQGQIQYPISINDMGKTYDNASKAVQVLLNSPILFEVPIGYVNIAPSREALSYDEKTSKNIIKAAEQILIELPTMILKAINTSKSEYEARFK